MTTNCADSDAVAHAAVRCDCALDCKICRECGWPLAHEIHCRMCAEIGDGFGPSHDGISSCESGSIASGGTKAHCTCDRCF